MSNRYCNTMQMSGLSNMNCFKDTKRLTSEQCEDLSFANGDFRPEQYEEKGIVGLSSECCKYLGKNVYSDSVIIDKACDRISFDSAGNIDYEAIHNISKNRDEVLTVTSFDSENMDRQILTKWKNGVNIEAYEADPDYSQGEDVIAWDKYKPISTHPGYSAESDQSTNGDSLEAAKADKGLGE